MVNHDIFLPHSINDLSKEDHVRFLYVKIKIPKNNKSNNKVLQIVDISNQILYDVVSAEKKLMSLINATVSHEMRNPVNSIYS
jgi:signal transduction histidine kinase